MGPSLRLSTVVAVLAFASGCGAPTEPGPSCGPTTCAGCCDANGLCQQGITAQSCGFGGAACVSCGTTLTCSAGACTTSGTGGGGSATGGGTGGGATGGGTGGGATGGGTGGGATGGGTGGGATGGGTGGGATGGGTGGGGMSSADAGTSCANPIVLALDAGVNGTTASSSNFAFSNTGGCRATSTAGDAVYRVDLPPAATYLFDAYAGTADLVLNVVSAPASNCGTGGAGATCVTSANQYGSSTFYSEYVLIENLTSSPASYFVIVDGAFSTSRGTYSLRSAAGASVPTGLNEIEPNDTKVLADAAAQVLTPGAIVRASLAPSEADLFPINVASAGVLRIDLGAPFCSLIDDVKLALLDSTGAERHSDIEAGTVSCRDFVAQVSAGTYYLAVSRTASSSRANTYWLTTRFFSTQPTETEPNNTTTQANLITGREAIVCGALSASDTADTYLFTLTQPAMMHAQVFEAASSSVTCESDLLDSELELLSGAGLLQATDFDDGRGLCSRIATSTPLAAGTYFLRVTDESTGAQGFPYCLALSLR